MEYWSHWGNKFFRLGPFFHGILVPRTNFFGDQFSSDSTISDKLQNYLNQSVNNYVNLSSMARNGVWATDAEIMATASLLEHDIVVYTKSGDSLQWLTFPSSFTLTNTSMTALYLENLSEHFNVVINVQS